MSLYNSGLLEGVRAELVAFAEALGDRGDFYVTEGVRSDARQAALYAQGRTVPGKVVTNAQNATQSAHGNGSAIDIYPYRNGDIVTDGADDGFAIIASLAAELGLDWGGNWKSPVDKPHVDVAGWRTYVREAIEVATSGPGIVVIGALVVGAALWFLLRGGAPWMA